MQLLAMVTERRSRRYCMSCPASARKAARSVSRRRLKSTLERGFLRENILHLDHHRSWEALQTNNSNFEGFLFQCYCYLDSFPPASRFSSRSRCCVNESDREVGSDLQNQCNPGTGCWSKRNLKAHRRRLALRDRHSITNAQQRNTISYFLKDWE